MCYYCLRAQYFNSLNAMIYLRQALRSDGNDLKCDKETSNLK